MALLNQYPSIKGVELRYLFALIHRLLYCFQEVITAIFIFLHRLKDDWFLQRLPVVIIYAQDKRLCRRLFFLAPGLEHFRKMVSILKVAWWKYLIVFDNLLIFYLFEHWDLSRGHLLWLRRRASLKWGRSICGRVIVDHYERVLRGGGEQLHISLRDVTHSLIARNIVTSLALVEHEEPQDLLGMTIFSDVFLEEQDYLCEIGPRFD